MGELFSISENETLGRHLIATRDITSGEIILKEDPLIRGPSQNTIPVCLGCGKEVNEQNSRPCSKCGWPVCDADCEKNPEHLPECFYTVRRGNKVSISTFGIEHPSYQCITVLRCLYQKQFNLEIWSQLDILESHCEERKRTQRYNTEKICVAQFIRNFFKLEQMFTEEEILRVCGIVMVNAHEVPFTDPSNIAIYGTTSMVEHNCSANCNKSFTNSGAVLLTSGKDIKKGEHISICYADPLWGTPIRRQFLNETKFFSCFCSRCTDPTEFGTYFSSVKCQKRNCDGLLLPKTFLEEGLPWNCSECYQSVPAYMVNESLERIGYSLSKLCKESSKECMDFVVQYEKYLHANHFYMTDVKLSLSELIGQNNMLGISENDLLFKASLCRSLSDLMKILIPAENRVRGLLLYELQATVSEIARRNPKYNQNGELLQEHLQELKLLLDEVSSLLKYEPDFMPEGKVYKQCLITLQNIESALRKKG